MSAIRFDSVTGRLSSDALRDAELRGSIGAPEGATAEEPTKTDGVRATSFSDILGGVVEEAAHRSQVADAKADAFARGALDDVHGTMIAAKEADISLKLVGSIRNKLLDAFQELWRTNV
jgi:flagellar hook-basal body complex protein FliE